jgi:hypothetical protein
MSNRGFIPSSYPTSLLATSGPFSLPTQRLENIVYCMYLQARYNINGIIRYIKLMQLVQFFKNNFLTDMEQLNIYIQFPIIALI